MDATNEKRLTNIERKLMEICAKLATLDCSAIDLPTKTAIQGIDRQVGCILSNQAGLWNGTNNVIAVLQQPLPAAGSNFNPIPDQLGNFQGCP